MLKEIAGPLWESVGRGFKKKIEEAVEKHMEEKVAIKLYLEQ